MSQYAKNFDKTKGKRKTNSKVNDDRKTSRPNSAMMTASKVNTLRRPKTAAPSPQKQHSYSAWGNGSNLKLGATIGISSINKFPSNISSYKKIVTKIPSKTNSYLTFKPSPSRKKMTQSTMNTP